MVFTLPTTIFHITIKKIGAERNFCISQNWEIQLLPISALPNFGKCNFCHFLHFPTLGNATFTDFCTSQLWEMQKSITFGFLKVEKANL